MPNGWTEARSLGLVVAALLAAVAAIYAQTFGFPFVHWDDPAYVSRNPHVLAGLTRDSIVWAFTDLQSSNWHPITWLSHMLDVELYGQEAGGHHATNVLLHGLNSLLVFALLRRMTGATWRSGAVAMLFAVHPIHVESVAWVSERKDVLSTFLALCSISAYVGFVRRPGVARYGATLMLFALGVMAKSMVVTLPAVLLLLDHWPLRRRFGPRLLAEKLPFFAISLAIAATAVLTQSGAGAMDRELPLPLWARLANAIAAYGRYLWKTVWPVDLAFFYPHPYIAETGGLPLSATEIAGWALLLAGITFVVLRFRDAQWALVGWCWTLGTLVPVIGLVQVGVQGMADRYLYLPSIGLFVLIVWAAAAGVERIAPGPTGARALGLVGVAVFVALSVAAHRQAAVWRSSDALFAHALEVVPRNPRIRFNVANRLRDAGRTEEAIAAYERVLRATPDAIKPNLNLANLLRQQGRLDEAITHYRHLVEVAPDYSLGHVNLASALRARGEIGAAIAHYERALALGPNAVAHYNLGNLLREEGRHEEAIGHYEAALVGRPREARIHNSLGVSLLEVGRLDEAIERFRIAATLDLSQARAPRNLGRALREAGRPEQALLALRRALRIAPDDPLTHRAIGLLLAEQGEGRAARPHLVQALRRDPADAEVRAALDRVGSAELGEG